MERRKLLVLAGGSLTVGLAGCSGGGDDNESENGDDNQTNESGNGNETNGNESQNGNESENGGENGDENGEESGEFTIEITSVSEEVNQGDSLTIGYSVTNAAETAASITVPVTINGESQGSEEFQFDGAGTQSGEFTYNVSGNEDLTITVGADGSSADATVEVVESGGDGIGEVVGTFTAESTGGIIWIGEDNEEEAREQALGFPPSEAVPEPLVMEAEYGEDRWQSTSIEFPPLDIGGLLPPEFEEFDVEVGVSAPEGFSGEFDPENGTMTMEGRLQVNVTIEGEPLNAGTQIAATTGESGALTGSFDPDADPMTATLVENEAVIEEETESSLVNDFLQLPRENPLWMELDLEIETSPN